MYYNLLSSMSSGVITPSYTARTTAFATATSITDTTILNALNTFDLGLISNGLDTKMKALYPFVGGSATNHKYNFMDARDLDVAFRLQFNGGWTHSSMGALPNGTNAYANTYLNPVAQGLSSASAHLSYYARTSATTTDPAEIGNYTDGTNAFVLQSKGESTQLRFFFTYTLRAFQSVATGATGFLLGSSTGGNTRRDIYKNGTSVGNNIVTDTAPSLGNYSLYLGAANISGSSVSSYTNSQSAFASIGLGLTNSESSTLYSLVQNMQTTLARQI